MANIMQKAAITLAKYLKLLQPHQFRCQQMFKYSDKYSEVCKAKDSVQFLKVQREHLKELRSKIIKERNAIREKVLYLDREIEDIKRKVIEKSKSKK